MVKITEKMKLNASMVKTVLEGMLQCKVEVGWSFSSNTEMLIYIYNNNSKYDYQKYALDYDDNNKDDSNYCSELIYQMLNGMFINNHESSAEERYIQDILEETECKGLFILDGMLCDSNNEISVDLSAIDTLHYDRIGSQIIIINDGDDAYKIDLATKKIYEFEVVK